MRNFNYGYKVGYRDKNSRLFIRKFIAHSHKKAHKILLYYRKYGHGGVKKAQINRFRYKMKPITQREILAGIWDENPFDALSELFLPPAYGAFLHRGIEKKNVSLAKIIA